MKKFSLLFVAILTFQFATFAQLLNNSFESWAGGIPVDWFASLPPSVTQGAVAYQGTSSAHLEVIDLGGGFPQSPFLSSFLTSTQEGHPVSVKHSSLLGWYQYMPQGNDVLNIALEMFEGSNKVGEGGIIIGEVTSEWAQFTVPIDYIPGLPNPDNVLIVFSIVDTLSEFATIGSMGYVDYLSLTGPSGFQQIDGLPEGFDLNQNYPNPFNPSTTIKFQMPEFSFVTLKVYDVLGSEIITLVNEEKPAGNYNVMFDAAELSSRTYFYRLQAGDFIETKKMILLR